MLSSIISSLLICPEYVTIAIFIQLNNTRSKLIVICFCFPQVFDKVATTDQICKALLSTLMDLRSFVTKELDDIENLSMGLLGDIKSLSLFYMPSINGKGGSRNPLPPPAPSARMLQATLRSLHNYLEALAARRLQEAVQGKKTSAISSILLIVMNFNAHYFAQIYSSSF